MPTSKTLAQQTQHDSITNIFVLQVLCEVRGVRSMFQRIMLPNVTKIEVCDWAKHDNVDETVEDNLLRHVCPGANVEYSRWAKPVYQ